MDSVSAQVSGFILLFFFNFFPFRLGAWQFLADMPYGSISCDMVWQIFWNIYCKQSSDDDNHSDRNHSDSDGDNRVSSPSTIVDIKDALKGNYYNHISFD